MDIASKVIEDALGNNPGISGGENIIFSCFSVLKDQIQIQNRLITNLINAISQKNQVIEESNTSGGLGNLGDIMGMLQSLGNIQNMGNNDNIDPSQLNDIIQNIAQQQQTQPENQCNVNRHPGAAPPVHE